MGGSPGCSRAMGGRGSTVPVAPSPERLWRVGDAECVASAKDRIEVPSRSEVRSSTLIWHSDIKHQSSVFSPESSRPRTQHAVLSTQSFYWHGPQVPKTLAKSSAPICSLPARGTKSSIQTSAAGHSGLQLGFSLNGPQLPSMKAKSSAPTEPLGPLTGVSVGQSPHSHGSGSQVAHDSSVSRKVASELGFRDVSGTAESSRYRSAGGRST